MSTPILDTLAARLEADLRLRFPDITVRFARKVEGEWVCRIDDCGLSWGDVATNFDDRAVLSPRETEQLLAEVTIEVADNLWPDDLTDPWPLCPHHGDHPLQAQFFADQAVWLCFRDSSVAVAVGALSDY